MLIRCSLVIWVAILSLAPTSDEARYFIIPNSRSPKGKYVLAYSVDGTRKVNWEKMSDSEYRNRLEDQGVTFRCDVLNQNKMSRVKKITINHLWGPHSEVPSIHWSAREEMFVTWQNVSWYPSCCQIVMVNRSSPADHVDLVKAIFDPLYNYMKKPRRNPINHHKSYYVFWLKGARFPAANTVTLRLNLFVPKGNSDWQADVDVTLHLYTLGKQLKAQVRNFTLVSLHPETPGY